MNCPPGSICACAVPCDRCECIIETDAEGNIIYDKYNSIKKKGLKK